MRRVFALVLFALWGCGPSLQLEAGGTAAVEPRFRVEAPLAPAAPALPKLTPCPAGWREEAGDVSTCEPWPETGRAPCAGESVHLPGTPGCAPLVACPADGWPAELLAGRTIVYVRAGAAGGTGTRAQPFGTLQQAVSDEKRLIGFGVLPLFALDQTDGPPLAMPAEPPDFDTSEALEHTVEQLRVLALAKCPHVTSIELRPRVATDDPDCAGWFHRPSRSIVVLTDVSPQQQFAVLVHELAHAILHGEVNHHEKPRKEVEAESTAFVVCHALGLDTSKFSLPYVASWANGDVAEVAAAGENVRRASLMILDALLGTETIDTSEAALDAGPQQAA